MKAGCSVYRKNICLVCLAAYSPKDLIDSWQCIVELISSGLIDIVDRRQLVFVKSLLCALHVMYIFS